MGGLRRVEKMNKKVPVSSLIISINHELLQALCNTLKCGLYSLEWVTHRMKRLRTEAFVEGEGQREWGGPNFLRSFAILVSRIPCS